MTFLPLNFNPKLLISTALLGCFTALQTALHFLRADLNPLNRFVSEYGVGSFNYLFMLSLLALGTSTIWLGFKIIQININMLNLLAGSMLIGSGLATYVVMLFPTDLVGQSLTSTGLIHGISAYISFIATALAYLLLIGFIKRPIFTILALLNSFLLISFNLAPKEIKGLTERLVLVSIIVNSVYLHNWVDNFHHKINPN